MCLAFIFVTNLGEQSNAWMLLRKFTNSILDFFSGTAIMSDFIESEAEESEEEFEEKDLKPKKTQRFMEEDGESLTVYFGVFVSEVRLYDVWTTHLLFLNR